MKSTSAALQSTHKSVINKSDCGSGTSVIHKVIKPELKKQYKPTLIKYKVGNTFQNNEKQSICNLDKTIFSDYFTKIEKCENEFYINHYKKNCSNITIMRQFRTIFSCISDILYSKCLLSLYNTNQRYSLTTFKYSYENFDFNKLTRLFNTINDDYISNSKYYTELKNKIKNGDYSLKNLKELKKILTLFTNFNNSDVFINCMNNYYSECFNIYIVSHKLLKEMCEMYSSTITMFEKESIFNTLTKLRLSFPQIKDNIVCFEAQLNNY